MYNWIERNIVTIVEILLAILAAMFIWKGVFSLRMLIKAIIILILMMLYKWVASKLILTYSVLPKTRYKFISEPVKNFDNKIAEFIFKPIFKKYPILIHILYVLIKYNPLLWVHHISCYVYSKMYDIIVWINGNKDIFFKKHFERDTTKWDLSVNNNKYYQILKFIFVYPFLRIFFIPKRIRERILGKRSYIGLFRTRFVVYSCSILLLYYGYYDIINVLSIKAIIIMVYIYFGIIWPILMYLDYYFSGKNDLVWNKHENYMFPYMPETCDRYDSISLYMYSEILCIIEGYSDYCSRFRDISYYPGRFQKIKVADNSSKLFMSAVFYDRQILLRDRWLYEKNYGVSYLAFRQMLFQESVHNSMERLLLIYKKGKEEFGGEYIEKTYRKYMKKLILVYMNQLMLIMDIRRLLGYKKEEWMYWPKDSLKDPYKTIFNAKEQLINLKKLLDKDINYKNVPENYMGIKLYNDLLNYSMIFELSVFRGCEIEWGSQRLDMKEEVLILKLEKHDYNKNKAIFEKNGISLERYSYGWSVITADMDLREEGKEYDYEFLNGICKTVEKQYMEEYSELSNEYKLVSKNHIEYLLKMHNIKLIN